MHFRLPTRESLGGSYDHPKQLSWQPFILRQLCTSWDRALGMTSRGLHLKGSMQDLRTTYSEVALITGSHLYAFLLSYVSFLIRRLCLSMVRVARSTAAVMPSKASSCLSSSVSVSNARPLSFLRICKGSTNDRRGCLFSCSQKQIIYLSITFILLQKICKLMGITNTLSTEPEPPALTLTLGLSSAIFWY